MQRFLIACAVELGLLVGAFKPTPASAPPSSLLVVTWSPPLWLPLRVLASAFGPPRGISFLVKTGSLAMLLAMPVIQQLVMCEHDVCDRVF
jgi:hypothetical protein